MNYEYMEIQELLQQRADLQARLKLLPYDGTPEIKERQRQVSLRPQARRRETHQHLR